MKSLLTSTENTRELGGYKTKDGNITKKNSILRSDVSIQPSQEDIDYLQKYHITTIIDLRCEEEAEEIIDGFANREGFDYYNCPIVEGSDAPESVEKVPESYLKIAGASNINKVFRHMAHANGGVMYHCSAGKDRSGVVSAILLMHAGVCDQDIIDNYLLTKVYLKKRLEQTHINYPELDMKIVTPCEAYMKEFLRLFTEKFKDTDNYFRSLGLSQQEADNIRELLVK